MNDDATPRGGGHRDLIGGDPRESHWTGSPCRRSIHTIRRVSVLALVLTVASRPVAAFGAAPVHPEPATLSYERPASLERACPDEVFFRHFVAARFAGVDPFTGASRRISVRLRAEEGSYAADLLMTDGDAQIGEDTLVDANCDKLVEAVGQRVWSWVLPPPAPPVLPAAPHDPPAPRPATPPTNTTPPGPPSTAPASPGMTPGRPRLRVVGGATVDVGLAPTPLPGAHLDASVVGRAWSAEAGVRWVPQASAAVLPGGSVITGLVTGEVATCARRAWPVPATHAIAAIGVAGCAVGELGQIRRQIGAPQVGSLTQGMLYGGGGALARVALEFGAGWFIELGGGVLGVRHFGGITVVGGTMGAAGVTVGATGQARAAFGWSFP